jgi:recombination protein RecR
MKIPKAISSTIESFESLPGIGPKTAQRLSFYLLHTPQTYLDNFSENIRNIKKSTVLCSVCKNVGESDPCSICSDSGRDSSVILVVEQPLDLVAFERSGRYKGLYHVLHGCINPLDNIGPDEIYIADLISRLTESNPHGGYGSQIAEVIIATNPTMEGEATAMYISKELRKTEKRDGLLKITRLGMGIPTGADLEYADEQTLNQALDGRRPL